MNGTLLRAVGSVILLAADIPEPEKPPSEKPEEGTENPSSFTTEVRLAVDKSQADLKKITPAETKTLEAVLKKRLPILGSDKGTVEVKSLDDIRVRVAADVVGELQLKMFTRLGRLELRSLEDVQTSANRGGRYSIDVLNVQGDVTIRFRDLRSNRVVPANEMMLRCPLLVGNADLEPGTARVVGDGALMAVRVGFSKQGSKRLRQFTRHPGRLMAIALDGQVISMHAVSREVKEAKKGQDDAQELGELDVGGGFGTREDAAYLAVVFNSGMLPCPLKVLSNGVVVP